MHPILFEIGTFPVYTYGILLGAAYLAGLQFARARARTRGLDPDRILDLGIWIIVSALVGAKAMLVAVDFRSYRSAADFLSIVRSAGVFYGGLVAAVLVAFWYLWRHRMPVWSVTDTFAPAIALGHAVGRMGCLLAGCCYGRPTSVAWAITFHNEYAAQNVGTPLGIPLHPTQLYDAGAELAILVILLAFERRGRPFAGRTFWAYLLLYGVSRFVIEFYRGDPRGMIGTLSTSQFVSVLLVPLSVVMLLALSRKASGAATPVVPRRARAAL
jgi:phosphatidylglycerol:prolipoprotein diacylglycerol transferase